MDPTTALDGNMDGSFITTLFILFYFENEMVHLKRLSLQ